MTLEEIKSEMQRRQITVRAMAKNLSMSEGTLCGILNGKRPFTERLRRHIELLLSPARDRMLVYRLEVPEMTVTELVGDTQQMTDEEKAACLAAVIRKNLELLAKLGAASDAWSDELRAALGLPPNGEAWEPTPDDFGEAAEDEK